MRQLGKYRGIHNGGWKKGFLSYNFKTNEYEIVNSQGVWPVTGESVGQSTGEKDCNKAEIFNKDWVKANIYSDEEPQILQVYYRKGAYIIDYKDSESDCVMIGEFVGSLELTDNPELLETGP